MEGSAKHLKALRNLRERLHTETEPDQLYQTLKKLSSVPILCDTLAEIGFRQTIELLKREQLLVPFAKDLAAKWSERSPLERQAETEPQDLALQMRLTREQAPRKPAAEDKAHEPAASRAPAADARECQPAGDKAEPWQQVEKSLPQTHTAKANPTQTETQTHLQLEKSQELRMQALKARIQSTEAKKPQSRQTKLLTINANNTSSGQQTESGPGGEASSDKNSLPEDSAPSHLQRAPRLPTGGSTKTQAKKRTPLMAKALRDYKNLLLQVN
ncbi:RNA polymerase II transcription factor SIII subunit A3-like-2 [Microtus ochrogaster]|uniref:RNA polymerase II transcription factor SIII subunit A3-like-2 n=1 Tax=Microtus ochrogaster TaxID=79684 RepID=A0A8J6L6H9_MICOH|nr:RNA polymerase II transcription factor SIII subunit A3-like-2 [Microtus ochrogaster]